jgi:dCTP deaminase
MLKSSVWIKNTAQSDELIAPFVDHSVRNGVISYGLGPYGYDMRLDQTYKRLKSDVQCLDPHASRDGDFEVCRDERIMLLPNRFILGRSVEYFRMPKKILGIVFGKSTYARAGVLVNVTPLEPEWNGYLTISIANCGHTPVYLYPNQGIAQVIFLESDDFPLFSYRDLNGKYNEQQEITVSRVQRS